MSELYLIRHGQASFGEENYDRLSALGIRQAQVAGRHLAGLGKSFDAIYCGRMDRQEKTAKELVDFYRSHDLILPELAFSDAFNEYDSTAVWELQIQLLIEEDPSIAKELENVYTDKKAFQRVFSKVMYRWVSGDFDRPGIQRWADYRRQVEQGFAEIMQRHGAQKRLAVFTSGGPICIAVQTALGLSDRKAIELNWQIMNASVSRFLYNRQGMALSVFNDVTHLELEGDKSLITYR